jgi:glycosyltransferase involved in cell wall biosynthesis
LKIAIFSRKFDGVVGGVERMVLALGTEFVKRGHEVTVISLDHNEATSFFEWPKEVRWIKLGVGDPDTKASFRVRLIRLILIRRQLIKLGIEAVIGFQIGSFALSRLAGVGLNIRFVAAERNAPTLYNYIRRGSIKRKAFNILLMTADVITVQLDSYRNLYPRFLRSKIRTTPNPVPQNGFPISETPSPRDIETILYVGRLCFQKNIHSLIRAVSLLQPPARLKIVGLGEDERELRELAARLGVAAEFLPFTNNLTDTYLDAKVFCLPSRWEGFPNVLGEALSFGLPVVGFQGCAGLEDLINPGLNGFLADGKEGPESLAKSLQLALEKSWDRNLVRSSVSSYSFDRFASSWEEAIGAKLW